jgi:hypothetical protein
MSELRYVGLQRSQEWYPLSGSPLIMSAVEIGGAVTFILVPLEIHIIMTVRRVFIVLFYE